MRFRQSLTFILISTILIFLCFTTFFQKNNLYKVQASDVLPDTTAAADQNLPTSVTTSQAISHTDTSITLQWESAFHAEGYELFIKYNETQFSAETAENSYTISNLPPAAIVTYTIRSYAVVGEEKFYSEVSDTFYAATTPSKVTGVTVQKHKSTSEYSEVITSWDILNDASYFIYYREKGADNFTLAGSTEDNTFTLSELSPSASYDIYVQAYCLTEDNTGEHSDTLSIITCPAVISNFIITKEESHQIELAWDNNPTGNEYRIYKSINDSDFELYKTTSETTLSETNLIAGTVYSYKIISYNKETDMESSATFPVRAVTTPYAATGLNVDGNTDTSLHLSWDNNQTATGYMVYRREGSGSFVYIASTTLTEFTDENLKSGKNYRYKIKTYADTELHTSDYSNVAKTSTLPASVNLKAKAGFGKIRLTWKKVSGVIGYYIYQKQDDDYTLITTIDNASTTSEVYTDLETDTAYTYKVAGYKTAFDKEYIGVESSRTVTPKETKKTTTTPSYYKTKKELLNSNAWKKVSVVKKYANYSKSYVIPGIRSTNVDGFESTKMCPQGLTFAGKYLLISAYDTYEEENSVIYVMDKSSKKLLTVLVLPVKTHAGGICYDGKRIWVTYGKTICAIDYNIIDTAAKEQDIYTNAEFSEKQNLGVKASFLAYYKNQIWTGNFEYTSKGKLRSYSVSTDEAGKTVLTQQSCVTIPAAVQGVTFSGNKLILSRAYGYTNELNVYKPKNIGKTNMSLGKVKKTVTVPALNEEIAVLGNYIYINFESGLPGSKALNHMDRVLAIKLKAII